MIFRTADLISDEDRNILPTPVGNGVSIIFVVYNNNNTYLFLKDRNNLTDELGNKVT